MKATKEQLALADRFWNAAREYVLAIAALNGIKVHLDERGDEFLFNLFEDGRLPGGKEILKELRELEMEQSA